MYPDEAQAEQAAQRLQQTALTQPALFVIEYALAQLWIEWGVQPQAMIGHSIGEYVAACLSGVFSLQDALTLVAARGRLMQSLPAGAMLSVSLPEAQVKRLLNSAIALAAVNAPNMCVVSGPQEAIDQLEQQLIKQDVLCRRLHTSHAFHSAMMEPILAEFMEQFTTITLKAPQRPFISNVTGTWITAAEATDPQYWAKHLRQTVRFADGVRELLKQPDTVLLEVGPGQTLSLLARQQLEPTAAPGIFSSLRRAQDTSADESFILNTLGQLWLAGVPIDWRGVHAHEQRRRVPLPTYPFERQRYWVDAQPLVDQAVAPATLSKRSNIDDWFYVPSWKRSTQPESRQPLRDAHWLVFLDECGVGLQLQAKLRQYGTISSVRAGQTFSVRGDGEYVINPRAKADYAALFKELKDRQQLPTNIVHLWTVSSAGPSASSLEAVADAQYAGFYSLLFLAQAIGDLNIEAHVQLDVISTGLHVVTGDERLQPEKATVLGPCRVIPHEYPNIRCRSIDVVLPADGTGRENGLADRLAATLTTNFVSETIVAQRGPYRWLPTFEPTPLDGAGDESLPLKEHGVYLITGGLGGIGLTLAEDLARGVKARLVLIGRSSLPSKDQWSTWLATHEAGEDIRQRIEAVQSLEALGAEVLIVAADVANLAQLQAAVAEVHARFGAIQGVIHAAGLPGGGMIQLKTPEAAESVMAPKVKGTQVLATVLCDEPLDFFVLCSSINSMLPIFGQVDYCAANAFMDAFAWHRQSLQGTRYVSINWGTWQKVGMAVNTPVPQQLKQARADSLRLGISPEEGQAAFRRILPHAMSQVVVSPVDFSAVMEQAAARPATPAEPATATPTEAARTAAASAGALHPRPNLRTAFVAPRSDLEHTVAEIWKTLLGIQPIGLNDDFFELGGHSLLATQVVSRLRDVLRVELPLRSLFEATTVAELAERLETILWAAGDQRAEVSHAADREEIESMNAQVLLSHLRQNDVQVWLDGDRLRVNAPKGVLTPELQTALAEHKVEIIALLRTAESTTRAALPPIVPVQRVGDPPLSFGQQRLWFLDQLTPGTANYNIAFDTRLPMLIDTGVLADSLTELVRRHEAMRTTFVTVQGKPVQRIAPPAPFQLSIIDLRSRPPVEREAEVRREVAVQAQRPFDLTCGPLFRATLLQTGRRRSRTGSCGASYHLRWHIVGSHDARAGGNLSRPGCGATVAAARTADSICGLRILAAPVSERRSPVSADWLTGSSSWRGICRYSICQPIDRGPPCRRLTVRCRSSNGRRRCLRPSRRWLSKRARRRL